MRFAVNHHRTHVTLLTARHQNPRLRTRLNVLHDRTLLANNQTDPVRRYTNFHLTRIVRQLVALLDIGNFHVLVNASTSRVNSRRLTLNCHQTLVSTITLDVNARVRFVLDALQCFTTMANNETHQRERNFERILRDTAKHCRARCGGSFLLLLLVNLLLADVIFSRPTAQLLSYGLSLC